MIVFDKSLICSRYIGRAKPIIDNFVPKILWLKTTTILNYLNELNQFESTIKNSKIHMFKMN